MFLTETKAIVGNASNDLGFVAKLLAHRYLQRTLPMPSMDAAEKAQGAAGLDVDARTLDGRRVVAEIKVTVPYGGTSLGVNHLKSWRADFQKLVAADADLKFFFVVDLKAFRAADSGWDCRYATAPRVGGPPFASLEGRLQAGASYDGRPVVVLPARRCAAARVGAEWG